MPESQDSIEWFHALAALDSDALADALNPLNRARLQDHIANSIPDHKPPPECSNVELAAIAQRLRQNEIAWNRATMAALIQAGDLWDQKKADEAVGVLERFAASCPWLLFRQVALDQASHYRP